VVSPKDWLDRAYSSLPTRMSVASSRRSTVASTFSRGSPGSARCASTPSRTRGSSVPKRTMRLYLVSSRTARQRGC
jgi:hypothetical protein